MKFDWKRFCTEYGVGFVTHGPNTARGNINIKCPYCGAADSSEHLGLRLNVNEPFWGCWRDARHSGKSPRRLVQKLLRCGWSEAVSIVENQLISAPEDMDLERAANALRQQSSRPTPEPKKEVTNQVNLLPEFKPLFSDKLSRYAQQFLHYLAEERGFGCDSITVAKEFNLHYALSGTYAWRMLIPFYQNSHLVGWTGRDIRKNARLRYNTFGSKALVFNADAVPENTRLIITEGPMDAIKMHFYGKVEGYSAVAMLGLAVTQLQVSLLSQVIRRCRSAVVLFDRDTLAKGVSLAEELSVLSRRSVRSCFLRDYADPGVIPPKEVLSVCNQLSLV